MGRAHACVGTGATSQESLVVIVNNEIDSQSLGLGTDPKSLERSQSWEGLKRQSSF